MIPLFLLVVLVGGWALDAGLNRGSSARNVTVAGTDVGGLDRTDLEATLQEVASGYADTEVIIRTADGEVTTTAGVVGLELDPSVTADNVMEIGRGSTVSRPFSWLSGLFGSRSASAAVRLGVGDLAALEATVNAGQPEPVEPALGYEDGQVVVVPGRPVQTFDLSNIREDVVAAARAGESPIVVEAGSLELHPQMTDDEAQTWADRFNTMTEDGITVWVLAHDEKFEASEVRSWMRFTDTGDEFTFTLDQQAVRASLRDRYGEPEQPDERVIEVLDGRPRLVGFIPTRCCAVDSHERILQAINDGEGETALVLEQVDESEEDLLREYGIFDLVGQATTPHDCCQNRVINIQLFADLIRGVILEPGESISLNDHVGRRTTEKGFVPAGVISRGELSSDVGGGISQFATTIFQAMFYGGIDIDAYQAHTLLVQPVPGLRWTPRGIESTISFPQPDVQFTNNTPYRVMIWPTYTDTSLTVSIYSIAVGRDGRARAAGVLLRPVHGDRNRSHPDLRGRHRRGRHLPGVLSSPATASGVTGKATNPTPTPVPTPTPEGGTDDDGGTDDGGDDGGDGGDDAGDGGDR